LIKMLFPDLSSLLVDEVIDQGAALQIRARTPATAVPCPRCGRLAERVHAYHPRRLATVPIAGRHVTVQLTVRRLVCQALDCTQRTFWEQASTLAQRWARRSRQLTALIADLAVAMAGRAGATVLSRLGTQVSRSTMLRALMAMPTSAGQVAGSDRPAPTVLSVETSPCAGGAATRLC
jgi:transposase